MGELRVYPSWKLDICVDSLTEGTKKKKVNKLAQPIASVCINTMSAHLQDHLVQALHSTVVENKLTSCFGSVASIETQQTLLLLSVPICHGY